MCFVVVDFKFRVLCFVKFHLLAIWVIFREKCLTGCVTVAYNAAFQEMELEGGGGDPGEQNWIFCTRCMAESCFVVVVVFNAVSNDCDELYSTLS